jgi:hypothetical protein
MLYDTERSIILALSDDGAVHITTLKSINLADTILESKRQNFTPFEGALSPINVTITFVLPCIDEEMGHTLCGITLSAT